ncbi:MAG: GxxExxY protein [Gammaproteobacteria bacterium]|nr:GxxExxY protein [Gammaproteobacteria bacterium]
MNKDIEKIAFDAIGAAIEVHKLLGPGLLERVYQECLAYELRKLGYIVGVEVILPVRYKEIEFDSAYRIDLLINNILVVEVKAVDKLNEIYCAQLLSYLRLSNLKLGLLMNFNVPHLKSGIKRVVNNL